MRGTSGIGGVIHLVHTLTAIPDLGFHLDMHEGCIRECELVFPCGGVLS